MKIIITESQYNKLFEMDFRNLDDIIKFGEFSEHFKKEDLKKIKELDSYYFKPSRKYIATDFIEKKLYNL